MGYKYLVNKRNPVSSYILDAVAPPYFDNTGLGNAGAIKSGSSNPTAATTLVSGAALSCVFSSSSIAQFSFNNFKVGLENRRFVLESWVLPVYTAATTFGDQQILSHGTIFDGLSINGKVVKFATIYATAGTAACTFDLVDSKAAHVVGVHNGDQNQLWVNGVLVAAVDLTDAQKADSYASAADGTLYTGYTTSTQKIAVNGVAFYNSLSADQINQNYQAGIDALPQAKVVSQFDGQAFNLNSAAGTKYIEKTWAVQADFNTGLKNNVEYSPTEINPAYVSGVSVAGSWTTAVPLDALGYTAIYGAMVEWSGNAVTVDTSLDGSTWTSAVNGALLTNIPYNYDPTNKDLQIRVSFAGGLADDPAYLESLTVIVYKDNIFANTTTRPVTVTYPAVLRGDYEPILYRDDNGVSLHTGTLTIGADTSSDPAVARTLELWIKPLSGTTTISVTGTKYRNGSADTSMPLGEWQLIHIVAASDVTADITITGDCIVGQATIYPDALTSSQIAQIYASYTGYSKIQITDTTSPITVGEQSVPTSIYTHDWAISSGG